MYSTTATVAAQKARKKQKQAMLMVHQPKSYFVTMFQIEKDKPLNDLGKCFLKFKLISAQKSI